MSALFQYGQDEQTIYIIAIGHSRRDPWDGLRPDELEGSD